METTNKRLNIYVGRVDGIQIRVNDTWDRMRGMKGEVRIQSSTMRAMQAEWVQQSDLLRQILAHFPHPPGTDTAGPNYQSPPPQ